jgi:opacity protein-like surface antigen
MKAVMTIVSAILLATAAIASAATPTVSITCYSGGTAVFTDNAVNFPVRVGPVRFGDPNDFFIATDTATGATTTIGGPGTVCVVTLTPASTTSARESQSGGVQGGIVGAPSVKPEP